MTTLIMYGNEMLLERHYIKTHYIKHINVNPTQLCDICIKAKMIFNMLQIVFFIQQINMVNTYQKSFASLFASIVQNRESSSSATPMKINIVSRVVPLHKKADVTEEPTSPNPPSHSSDTVYTLTIGGLSDGDGEEVLRQHFETSIWIHKCSSTDAYVCFDTPDDRDRALIATKLEERLPQHWTVSMTNRHISKKLLPFAKPKVNFLFAANVCRKKLANKSSFFICAHATELLMVTQWQTIFTNALAIHRSSNRSKVYVEYDNLQNARQDCIKATSTSWTFTYKSTTETIYSRISCHLVSSETVEESKLKLTPTHIENDLHMDSILSSALSCLDD